MDPSPPRSCACNPAKSAGKLAGGALYVETLRSSNDVGSPMMSVADGSFEQGGRSWRALVLSESPKVFGSRRRVEVSERMLALEELDSMSAGAGPVFLREQDPSPTTPVVAAGLEAHLGHLAAQPKPSLPKPRKKQSTKDSGRNSYPSWRFIALTFQLSRDRFFRLLTFPRWISS